MSNYKTVDEYIDSFDGITKEYLQQFRLIIHRAVPDTTELINYNIAAFTLVDGGKRDQQVMIAGYARHIGFYPHPSTIEHFWGMLDGHKKAKGSVQFSLVEALPEKLIIDMVKYRKKLLQA